MSSNEAAEYPLYLTDVAYSDLSSLNTLRICLPRLPSPGDSSRIWLIYIHGGAWHDPEILASSFDKLQEALLQSGAVEKLAGLASIDYRLSPYPSHRSLPSDPFDPARNASHPDHIDDVLHALLFLQEKYKFGERYVLVGHSCGATLALQVAQKRYWGAQYESSFADELNVVPPLAIVGVDGIYSLTDLVDEYANIPDYREFVVNAFGTSEKVWTDASPAAAKYAESWPDGRLLMLVHSTGDELLSGRQRQVMLHSLQNSDWEKADDHEISSIDLHDLKHDEVWRSPAQLTKVLANVVHKVAAYV